MRAHDAMITSFDGVPIACRRRGAGPALVLVHGTGDDHSRWGRVAESLARSFTVHAMDRRGHGASGDGPRYSLEAEAMDVVAVAAAAGDPVVLVGHSYGAICCLEAARRSDALAGLVLYEPPLPRHRAALGVLRSPTVRRELEAALEFSIDALSCLDVPALLVLGARSPRLLARSTSELEAVLADVRVEVMPAQGHFAMDTAPDRFAAVVRRFAEAGPTSVPIARPM